MKGREAPAVLLGRDVAVDWARRVSAWPAGAQVALGGQAMAAVLDLACALATAGVDPAMRSQALEQADRSLMRVRVIANVSRDLGLLSDGALGHFGERHDTLGKMIGGWRRHEASRPARRRS